MHLKQGKSRVEQREKDKIEARGFEYLLDIQENMKSVAKKMNLDYILIDATAKIEDINRKIIEYINK